MASWSELADRALLAAAIACRYQWPAVASRLEATRYGARTAQACERRLRLLLERERTLRKEHLRRLIAEPVTRAKRTDALFREAEALNAKRADGDVTFPQGAAGTNVHKSCASRVHIGRGAAGEAIG